MKAGISDFLIVCLMLLGVGFLSCIVTAVNFSHYYLRNENLEIIGTQYRATSDSMGKIENEEFYLITRIDGQLPPDRTNKNFQETSLIRINKKTYEKIEKMGPF